MADEPYLTHLDAAGRARMVDVTAKPWTRRLAVARGRVATAVDTTEVLSANGDAVHAARAAGVHAAKVAWDLIPLCHPIRLVNVELVIDCVDRDVHLECVTEVVAPTGVEMEALAGCTIAGLALVQVLRRVDPGAQLTDVTLWRKEGGRTGVWVNPRAES